MEKTPSGSLNILQPSNLLVFMVFYSPIIVAISIIAFSVIIQSSKGFIYLGFMFAVSIIREFLYYAAGAEEVKMPGICSVINYSTHGNNTYSSFMIAFTLMYMCLPMYLNGSMNWFVLGTFISYLSLDIMVRGLNKCVGDVSVLFLNVASGLISGLLIIIAMNAGGSSKFLFFNEMQSSKVVCTRPKKQQFKCAVYKNGELISNNVV
jgi:hypothetical protein